MTMGTNNTEYPTTSSIQAVAGDVCFINLITKDFVILSHNEWDMLRYSENLIPIGVVVIPGVHNVYGDGSCAIVDLDDTEFLYYKTFNHNIASIGPDVCFSKSHKPINEVFNKVVVAPSDEQITKISVWIEGYLPSDAFAKTNCKCLSDPKSTYAFSTKELVCPSPYLENETRNPIYHSTEEPSTPLNVLSDFGGKENTKKMVAKVDITSIDDIKAIGEGRKELLNDYWAAVACYGQRTWNDWDGEWYLPSCGEFGYVMARLNEINSSLYKLGFSFGNSNVISPNNKYWTSTEHSEDRVYQINIRNGLVEETPKYYKKCIRAFRRILI